jgi:mRNA interferase HicA
LHFGQECPTVAAVNGIELVRQLRRLAMRREMSWRTEPGKGSHLKVWMGERRTVVPQHREDLGIGLRRSILRQLGLTETDLKE